MVDKNSKTRTMRRKEYIQSFYCYRIVFSLFINIDFSKNSCYNGRFWSNAQNMHIFVFSASTSVIIESFIFRLTSPSSGFNGFLTVVFDQKLIT